MFSIIALINFSPKQIAADLNVPKMESFIKEDNLQVTSPQIDFYEDYVGRLERVNTRDRLAFIVVVLFFFFVQFGSHFVYGLVMDQK